MPPAHVARVEWGRGVKKGKRREQEGEPNTSSTDAKEADVAFGTRTTSTKAMKHTAPK